LKFLIFSAQIIAKRPNSEFMTKLFQKVKLSQLKLFISLTQSFLNHQFWINDLYQNLYTFWKMSQTDLLEVVEQVKEWKQNFVNGKELFK